MNATASFRRPCTMWGAAALLYVVAVGTSVGRRFDEAVFVRAEPFARTVSDLAVASVNGWTLAVVSVSAVVVTVRRGDRRTAAGVALVVLCANASSFATSHMLGELALVDGESARALGRGFFPSGHATAAMTMACAVVAAAPARYARRIVVGAGTYASLVAASLFAFADHYASDVLGGILLTAGWQALAHDTTGVEVPVTDGWTGSALRLVVAAAATTAAVMAVVLGGGLPDAQAALAGAIAVVTGTVFGCLLAFARSPGPDQQRRAARTSS